MSNTHLTSEAELFVEYLFDEELTGGNAAKAKQLAGYSANSSVASILKSAAVREAIKQRTEEFLTANGAKAVMQIGRILSDPNIKGAKILKETAADVLDRIGVVKKMEQNQQTVVPNITIILPPKNEE